jgi:SAM-dependent methyltransferase
MDPKQVVRDGYNEIGERYRPWSDSTDPDTRVWFLGAALEQIPAGSDVLELGCGPGIDAVRLAADRTYTGVDISDTMVALARDRVPAGSFLRADLATVDFPEASFDAVVSFYVFGHLPADEHAPTYGRVFRWLRPGGVFCSSFPRGGGDEFDPDFIGAPMFFGGIGQEATERELRAAGFVIEMANDRVDDTATQEGFLWVIARKPPP